MEVCEDCRSCTVGAYAPMYGKRICGLCRAFHNDMITLGFYEYMQRENQKPCRFCRRIEIKKNFDHVNMFHKSGSVGFMVKNGSSQDDIIAEVQKCQVLCVECHRVVTAYERRKGFMEKKKWLRLFPLEENKKKYAQEYDTVMTEFYEWMEKVGGRMVAGGEI